MNCRLRRNIFAVCLKKYTGQTFLTYVNQIRLQYFHSDLLQTDESITYLMNKNGITNYKVFLRSFKEAYGMPPGQLRKKQREVRCRSNQCVVSFFIRK